MNRPVETEIAWEGEGVTVPLAHPITITERRRTWFGGVRVATRRIARLRLTPPTLADLEALCLAPSVSPTDIIALCSDLDRRDASQLRWMDGEAALAALVGLLPADFVITSLAAPTDPAISSVAEVSSPSVAASTATLSDPMPPLDFSGAATGDPGEIIDFFEKG